MVARHRLGAVLVFALLALPPLIDAQQTAPVSELIKKAKKKKASTSGEVWTADQQQPAPASKAPVAPSLPLSGMAPAGTQLYDLDLNRAKSSEEPPPAAPRPAGAPAIPSLPMSSVAPSGTQIYELNLKTRAAGSAEAPPPAAAPPTTEAATPSAPLEPPPPAKSAEELEREAAAEALRGDPTPDEIRPVETRWKVYRTLELAGHPELTYGYLNPYQQNILKADYPIHGDWFLELNALQTFVFKSRRNLDFSNVFADQIALGNLRFFRHNAFYGENIIAGGEIRLHEDAFVPSPFRFRVNAVGDFKSNINAFNAGDDGNAHLFDAFADIRLHDFGRSNFDLVFLRAGFQGFRSDFHGLVFNDIGLGGRIFGESKKNRLRYDLAYFKLFQKDAVSGFLEFTRPSNHQVGIARLSYDDFLRPGWNSEWTFHYNRDRRKFGALGRGALDTFYFGATFNGRLGRFLFNPAFAGVVGNANVLEGGSVLADHDVRAWMGLLDLRYPLDFWTFRAGYLYASGDSNPGDRRDTGFDAISDGVVLFGGPLSYWVGENIKFGSGDFVRANSLFPSFRGINDPANHINPGLQAVNLGVDVNFAPTVQTALNMNYLRFNETGGYTNRIAIVDHDAGVEWNLFVRWKPFLRRFNENFVIDYGFGVLKPLPGLREAFQTRSFVYSNFTAIRFIF
ncbi:MAG: alginate export family protein [Acidobacteria bacterium]|nr:alginate export family protein [Acidobacteriota bacterium]